MMQGTNFVAASLPYADESLSLGGGRTRYGASSARSNPRWMRLRWETIVAGLRLTSQPVQLGPSPLQDRDRDESGAPAHNLGMKSAFDSSGAADFSSMGWHRAFSTSRRSFTRPFIDVTEAGTEAAAVTIVVGTGPRREIAMPVNFTAKPSLSLLPARPAHRRHPLHGARVLDPSQN